jgi:hypothetical protein
MQSVRAFLWVLAGTMTLQGYLHADEYGTAPGLFGGLALAVATWQHRIRDFFTFDLMAAADAPSHVRLPRALVRTALQETARHPDIYTIPALQQTLTAHHVLWQSFRDAELEWMLRHAQLLGAMQAEPDARALWSSWSQKADSAANRLRTAQEGACNGVSRLFAPASCQMYQKRVAVAAEKLATVGAARRAWSTVLDMRSSAVDVGGWWAATQTGPLNLTDFETRLAHLHDVRSRADTRIADVLHQARHVARYTTEHPWLQRLLESLLTGQVWVTCQQHVQQREQRVRDIMLRTGIQELYHRFDQVLNASRQVAGTEALTALVDAWFAEMGTYAWWMTEDMPRIVQRCLQHEDGECTRIGPAEIAALAAQMDERTRILKDGVRRVVVGLWNAMPVVGLLFGMEVVILIANLRTQKVREFIKDEPRQPLENGRCDRDGGRRHRHRHRSSSRRRLQEEVPERLDTGNREIDGGMGR